MKFTGHKASFGRHETFPLRYAWLPKGVQELHADPCVFEAEDATVRLGVGKNMVHAIRYWLQAARVIVKGEQGWQLTPVGKAIFGKYGHDPYLEDEATLWLIHWLIASNPETATAWWWFYNRFHKPEFDAVEVGNGLVEFTKSAIKSKVAATTIRKDVAVLIRMYTRSTGNKRVPLDEALDSPLSLLNLVSSIPGSTKRFASRPASRNGLPLGILGFAVAEVCVATGARQIPIQELMYGVPKYPAIGAVFRLTESALLAKLEGLVGALRGRMAMRETAGIHQLYLLGELDPLELLEFHYLDTLQETAA